MSLPFQTYPPPRSLSEHRVFGGIPSPIRVKAAGRGGPLNSADLISHFSTSFSRSLSFLSTVSCFAYQCSPNLCGTTRILVCPLELFELVIKSIPVRELPNFGTNTSSTFGDSPKC